MFQTWHILLFIFYKRRHSLEDPTLFQTNEVPAASVGSSALEHPSWATPIRIRIRIVVGLAEHSASGGWLCCHGIGWRRLRLALDCRSRS